MKTAHVAGHFRAGNFVDMACSSGTADVSQVGAAVGSSIGGSSLASNDLVWSTGLVERDKPSYGDISGVSGRHTHRTLPYLPDPTSPRVPI